MLSSFLSLLFPNLCVACSRSLSNGEKEICTICIAALPKTNDHLNTENELALRFWGKVKIQQSMAYLKFQKGNLTQALIHAIKYKNRQVAAELLGKWYGYELKLSGFSFDLIIPVPLHKSKRKARGFNQSERFGFGLSIGLQCPCSEVLQRTHKNYTQTNKGRLERWENVNGIYELKNPELIVNKSILLVDDVITTGATIESCAAVMSAAHSISVAAIARAQH